VSEFKVIKTGKQRATYQMTTALDTRSLAHKGVRWTDKATIVQRLGPHNMYFMLRDSGIAL
jgi:hypothetical protein